MKRGLVAVLVGVAAIAPAEARHLSALGAVELTERVTAPDFTLPTPSGGSRELRALRGTLVLLTFWATWCLPCVEELPALERLHRELSRHGFTVLAVALDVQGAKVVTPFWEKSGNTFPTLLDPRQHVATRYGAWALPTAFLIDPGGQVVARIQGPRPWDSADIHAAIRGLLP
ncbi:MAG: peroxiredoxin family protein [Candidatus Rokuibacteriota bacterium]